MLSIGALFFSEMKENLNVLMGDINETKKGVDKANEKLDKILENQEEKKVSRNYSLFFDFSMLIY